MGDECPICLESMKEASALCKTECGHRFHSKCIFNSIVFNVNCPICRTQLAKNVKPKITVLGPRMEPRLIIERYDSETNTEYPDAQQTHVLLPALQFIGRRNALVDSIREGPQYSSVLEVERDDTDP
tara:strand:+ start:152 stop:532 length:381 start_codon:yes stop_codon:yes gene_type:complete